MSFSASISGHFDDDANGDAAVTKEAALVSDLKELVARYPEISSASFSGQFSGYLSLLPNTEEAAAADVPDGDEDLAVAADPSVDEGDEDSGVAEDVEDAEED